MTLSRLAIAFAISVAASLALGLIVHEAISAETNEGDGEIVVEWDFRPESLDDLAAHSEAVVLATAVGSKAGSPIESVEESVDFSLPTQLVDFQLVELIAGEVPDRFTLFKLGDESASLADDPAYEIGKQYLLFVRPREGAEETKIGDGTWIVTAPDGRLDPESDGSLRSPVEDSVVADSISGMASDELASAVEDEIGEVAQVPTAPDGSNEIVGGSAER